VTTIPRNAKWTPNGVTIAGGHGDGGAPNQLKNPFGLYVNEDGTVFIADAWNHRIVEWKRNDTSGRVVAGGRGEGNRMDQLNEPTDVLVDKETDSLIICDRDNRRVMRWSRRSGTTSGEKIIDNIDCCGLTMDGKGYLYVTDVVKHEVRRYRLGETTTTAKGRVVAGGNGKGDRLNQLNDPRSVFVDGEQSVYVSDFENHRVIKWVKRAAEGIIVAGGRGKGADRTQLSSPQGLFVDVEGTVYVAEAGKDLVTRWHKGVKEGEVIAGGNGDGEEANQLKYPAGLSLDQHDNLYVIDFGNHRVQRFTIEKTN
jgi:sugar lactone lactonase YvrE